MLTFGRTQSGRFNIDSVEEQDDDVIIGDTSGPLPQLPASNHLAAPFAVCQGAVHISDSSGNQRTMITATDTEDWGVGMGASVSGGAWEFEATIVAASREDVQVRFGVADGDVPFPGGEGWCLTTCRGPGEAWHYANACEVQSGGRKLGSFAGLSAPSVTGWRTGSSLGVRVDMDARTRRFLFECEAELH